MQVYFSEDNKLVLIKSLWSQK